MVCARRRVTANKRALGQSERERRCRRAASLDSRGRIYTKRKSSYSRTTKKNYLYNVYIHIRAGAVAYTWPCNSKLFWFALRFFPLPCYNVRILFHYYYYDFCCSLFLLGCCAVFAVCVFWVLAHFHLLKAAALEKKSESFESDAFFKCQLNCELNQIRRRSLFLSHLHAEQKKHREKRDFVRILFVRLSIRLAFAVLLLTKVKVEFYFQLLCTCQMNCNARRCGFSHVVNWFVVAATVTAPTPDDDSRLANRDGK